MTLMVPVPGIAIRPNDGCGFVARAEFQGPEPRTVFVNGHRTCRPGLHRLLDDRHQFALQRKVIARRPLAQMLHHAISCVLDRQFDGHRRLQISSNLEQN